MCVLELHYPGLFSDVAVLGHVGWRVPEFPWGAEKNQGSLGAAGRAFDGPAEAAGQGGRKGLNRARDWRTRRPGAAVGGAAWGAVAELLARRQ
ncbi:hypothetical protein NDU88_003237 [Pleurodeles waltl]|uniref:Uncharacterized protein n=1 Tax=Pleurodeles waltl TaxID=8319 RepID=A0AAV7M2U3_PLEWA|nr:hypothetical protein NDU88_003237 [Pleurodeles waltl]